jgi:hypothetical protein
MARNKKSEEAHAAIISSTLGTIWCLWCLWVPKVWVLKVRCVSCAFYQVWIRGT